MPVLSVQQLVKNYGRIPALKGVSFDVPEGSVFGLLGPNGSGKTTLLGIVLDVLRPTAGEFSWFDAKPDPSLRRKLGTLLETPNFYHYLSAIENLKITAAIKQQSGDDIDSVLKMVNLYERKDTAFGTYSLGMKQRLAIAAALMGNPPVLVLDEPTNGLDPVGIAEIRNLIRELAAQGKTIIMASHLLDEVEKVCTHVAILKYGQLIVSGEVNEILVHDEVVDLSASDMPALRQIMEAYPNQKGIDEKDGMLQVHFASGVASCEVINRFCFNQGIVLNKLLLKKKSLETKFLELTQQ